MEPINALDLQRALLNAVHNTFRAHLPDDHGLNIKATVPTGAVPATAVLRVTGPTPRVQTVVGDIPDHWAALADLAYAAAQQNMQGWIVEIALERLGDGFTLVASEAVVQPLVAEDEPGTTSEVPGPEAETKESPVSGSNADVAIDSISRMRTPDRLQEIIDNDSRVTVREAAARRLSELG